MAEGVLAGAPCSTGASNAIVVQSGQVTLNADRQTRQTKPIWKHPIYTLLSGTWMLPYGTTFFPKKFAVYATYWSSYLKAWEENIILAEWGDGCLAGICCSFLKARRQVIPNCTCCNLGGICLADKYLTVTKDLSASPCMDTLSVGSKQYTPFFRAAVPSRFFFFSGRERKIKSKIQNSWITGLLCEP